MTNHFDAKAYAMIRASADRHEIPYHILKTAIAMESNGHWDPDRAFVDLKTDRGAIYPYTGMFESEVETLGYDPEQVRISQELQVDALAANLAYLKLSMEWQGVFSVLYRGMAHGSVHMANAMTVLKQSMGEEE